MFFSVTPPLLQQIKKYSSKNVKTQLINIALIIIKITLRTTNFSYELSLYEMMLPNVVIATQVTYRKQTSDTYITNVILTLYIFGIGVWVSQLVDFKS